MSGDCLSQGWKDTVHDAIDNIKWDEYDNLIKKQVEYYEKNISNSPSINWSLIKAILWVESGGPKNAAWQTRPMQIGNIGDPGWGVLQAASQGQNLSDKETAFAHRIMSTELKQSIGQDKRNSPQVNIKAGIAYLMVRMAELQFASVPDPLDTKKYTVTVKAGDNASRLADRVGTTLVQLHSSNPMKNINKIYPGDQLSYQKAKVDIVVIRWSTFNAHSVSARYNSNGRICVPGKSLYSSKLEYVQNTVYPQLLPESRKLSMKASI